MEPRSYSPPKGFLGLRRFFLRRWSWSGSGTPRLHGRFTATLGATDEMLIAFSALHDLLGRTTLFTDGSLICHDEPPYFRVLTTVSTSASLHQTPWPATDTRMPLTSIWLIKPASF